MVKIYKQPFAHGGDAIAIPSASQPDGKMSSADGWTPDYQLPSGDPNYKPVDRQEMNGVFKEVTEALGQVQVQGAAAWSADGAPYPINAQVYHNGKQWIALRANSVVPAEGADWSAIVTVKQLATKAALSHTHTWSQVTGKPVNYPTNWANVDGKPVVQTVGASTTNLMSQKAVTDAINNSSIGVGQTWQSVTGSRAKGTTYTNTTGRPIQILVQYQDAASSGTGATFKIGSLSRTTDDLFGKAAYPYWFSAVIPNGNTYSISGGVDLPAWWELR